MKNFRIFLAAALCVSLLTFAGCGNSNDAVDDNANDGTVTEENADMDNGNGTNDGDTNGNDKGDSVTDDMADDAKDVVDDVEDVVDGNDRDDATKAKNNN